LAQAHPRSEAPATMLSTSMASVSSTSSAFTSAFARRPKGPPPKISRVRIASLSGAAKVLERPGSAYFVRCRAGDSGFERPLGPRLEPEAHRDPETGRLVLENFAADPDRQATCLFRHVFANVPLEASLGVSLEVRRASLLPSGEQLPSELVGVVTARQGADGFATYPVLHPSGATAGMHLCVAVESVPEAAGRMTLQVDRLFDASKVGDATYFLQAGLKGAEQHATPPSPAAASEREGCEDCLWRHVLQDIPHSAEGVSVLLYRTSREHGLVQLGSFVVAQRTIGFASFPVLGKDGEETGMTVRLCAPLPEEPQRRQSWFRRPSFLSQGSRSFTRTGSFSFPPEQLAKIAEGSPTAKLAKIAEEPSRPSRPSQPRQRPSQRRTRKTRKTDGSVWSELPDDDDEDVKWSVKEEQEQWPSADEEEKKPEKEKQPEAEESPPEKTMVRGRVAGGHFKLSDSVMASKPSGRVVA